MKKINSTPKGSIIFGKMLETLISDNNDTFESLAEYLSCSAGYIYNIIAARSRINPTVFEKIMEKYKVPAPVVDDMRNYAVFTLYANTSWEEKYKTNTPNAVVEIKKPVVEKLAPEQVIIKMMKANMPTLSEQGKKQIKRLLKAYE